MSHNRSNDMFFQRKKGVRFYKELLKMETRKSKIIDSLCSRGGIVKMKDIVDDTGLPRQTVHRYLTRLKVEGHIKSHGKLGWEVLGPFYKRGNPLKLIKSFTEGENYVMHGNPEFHKITIVELPSSFLSPKQITEIRRIINDCLNEKFKKMPESNMLSVLINKRSVPHGKYVRGIKLSKEKRRKFLENIKNKQDKSEDIRKLLKKLRKK